jgi:nucleotide-binding universal stress UspA family protein
MSTIAKSDSEQADSTSPIVVGVDGSPTARLALDWAIREAEAHGNPVLAISSWELPAMAAASPGYSFAVADMQELADICRRTLVAEIAEASKGHPSVQIEPRVVEGPPALALIDASEHAAALVTGSRGHGGFLGLLVGSVSQQCVTHAHCPVMVIRPRSGIPAGSPSAAR